MSEVKGSAVIARMRFVRDRWGEAGWRRLRAGLAKPHRSLVDQRILPHHWVPFELFVDLNLAADSLFGRGDLALCREMGAHSAEVNLPTLYRIFFRLGRPSYILKKAARLWDVHYSSGRLVVEELPDGAMMRIEGFDTPHQAHCLSVLGWAERSVILSGGRDVVCAERSCRAEGDAACEMEARWR